MTGAILWCSQVTKKRQSDYALAAAIVSPRVPLLIKNLWLAIEAIYAV